MSIAVRVREVDGASDFLHPEFGGNFLERRGWTKPVAVMGLCAGLVMPSGRVDEPSELAATVTVVTLRESVGGSTGEPWLEVSSGRLMTDQILVAFLMAQPKPVRCQAARSGGRVEVTCAPQALTGRYELQRDAVEHDVNRLRAAFPRIDPKVLVRTRAQDLVVTSAAYKMWARDYYVQNIVEILQFPDEDAAKSGTQALLIVRSAAGVKGSIDAVDVRRKG